MNNICTRLINKVWREYAVGSYPVDNTEGIYVIGDTSRHDEYIYLGRSNDIRRRLREHRSGTQEINEYIQEKIANNQEEDLRIKWVDDGEQATREGSYLACMEKKLGYRPEFNLQGGDN